MKTYCLECHGGRETKKGVRVDSYANLVKAGRGALVVPGNADRSRLVAVLTGGGKQMPPRKFGKQPTKDEIAMIKAWIAAGAKTTRPTPRPRRRATPRRTRRPPRHAATFPTRTAPRPSSDTFRFAPIRAAAIIEHQPAMSVRKPPRRHSGLVVFS